MDGVRGDAARSILGVKAIFSLRRKLRVSSWVLIS